MGIGGGEGVSVGRQRWVASVLIDVAGGEEVEFREAAQAVALQVRRGWQERFSGSRVVHRCDRLTGADELYSTDFDAPLLPAGLHEETCRMTGRAPGVVREWHDEEGWGVLDIPGLERGCWAHYLAIEMAGYRALDPGQSADVEWERATRDG